MEISSLNSEPPSVSTDNRKHLEEILKESEKANIEKSKNPQSKTSTDSANSGMLLKGVGNHVNIQA